MIFFTQWSNLSFIYLFLYRETIFFDCILLIHVHVSLVAFWFSWITPKKLLIPYVNVYMEEPVIQIVDILSHQIPTVIAWNYRRPKIVISKDYAVILYFIYVLFISLLGHSYVDLYNIDHYLFYLFYLIATYIINIKNYISINKA